jgi:uncharacterized Ntn-hydrolase superfamily protein
MISVAARAHREQYASCSDRAGQSQRESVVTYSIVARDDATGDLGAVVQSCVFGVGSLVAWARPGIGAVATQAIAEPAYGPWCLDQLAAGDTAPEALAKAQSRDPMRELRQVGVASADRSVAAVTGDLCIDHAGQLVGDGFVVVANMVATSDVVPAMASAFAGTSGPLARRLLAGLEAGENAGGDARGRMSAALLVVDGTAPSQTAAGIVVDVRVDRSDDPIGDLVRLVDAADAFAVFNQAVEQLGVGDPAAALERVNDALGILPDDGNLRFARSGALLALGATEEARAELRSLVAERSSWAVILRSFVEKGLINLPAGVSIGTLLGQEPQLPY